MPDIGVTLQEARMRAGIDMSEVEAATKIRAKYLRAIENEEWELLPGPTFVKSFLRTYADYLGIDARLLVDEYKLRHEPPVEQDLQPISPSLGAEPRRPWRPPQIPRGWAIGLSVVGVFGLLILIGSVGEDEESQSLRTRTQATRKPGRRAVPPPAPRPTRVTLQLIPNDVVYVCLRDAQDELVLSDTLEPDSERRTYRSKRFRLTLGNNSIELRVNGRLLSVPSSAEAINYELTPRGRKRLSQDENAC
jgi:transcriptional regulator with XRE-family HTH domain